MRSRVLIVLLALVVSGAACGDSDQPSLTTDPGGAISVDAGDEFMIRLESNASTGYSWQLAEDLPEGYVELVSENYLQPDTDTVGAPGHQEFTFRAIKDGSTYIQLWYIREFDDPPEPADRAQYELIIGSGRPADIRSDGTDAPSNTTLHDPSALTLIELLDTAPTEEVAVITLLFDDGSGLRMCEVFAESFPPQCMGRTVTITNPEGVDADYTQQGDVRWTDRPTQLTGTLTDEGFTARTGP